MLELIRKSKNYVLGKEEGALVLCVVIGNHDIEELNYTLNSGEIYQFESQGELFLDSLAQKIRDNPKAYRKERK